MSRDRSRDEGTEPATSRQSLAAVSKKANDMVTFLTSIRHPRSSSNFAKVESLFEMSLRSVCSQSDSNFAVVVVANDVPRINFKDSRVTYHIVDFPCPDPQRSSARGIPHLFRDKGTKLIAGMLAAKRFKPDYFAIFDADDLVSRRIAQFVNTHSNAAGWYVDSGYVVNSKTWMTQRKSGLYRYCGSTLVPNASQLLRLARIEESVSTDLSQDQIVRLSSPQFVDQVIGNHPYMIGYFASHGLRMRPLPFRAACWILETGENSASRFRVEYGLPISEEICREFGISDARANNRPASIADRVRENLGAAVSSVGALRARIWGGFPLPPGE